MGKIKKHEDEVKMQYITSIEERALGQGIELGVQKMFLMLLNNYFSTAVPQNVQERVQTATTQELELWVKKILEKKLNLEELAI